MIIEELERYSRENNLPVYAIGEYYKGEYKQADIRPANKCNAIYSISKNFSATAVGFLIDRGELSLDDNLYDLFHDDFPDVCGDGWKKVTVRHVLTQTTGYGGGFLDIDCEDMYATYGNTDYLEVCLSKPLVHPAGTVFTYSDSHFYLAGRIVAKVTGEPMQEFMRHEFFDPLQYSGHCWALCPNGHAIGGSGLYMNVHDLTKLGQLYISGGVWEGKRILSEDWCREATAVQFTMGEKGGYGYSFWKTVGLSYSECGGMFGQKLLLFPDKDLVVGWLCYDDGCATDELSRMVMRL